MRLSRTKRKKTIRRLTLPQLAGIVVISAYGIGQITTPTYALLTNSSVMESSGISTAFVFPSTVDEIANLASEAMRHAAEQREAARGVLSEIRDNSADSESAEGRIGGITEAAGYTREASAAAAALLAQLQGYSIRSQQDLELKLNEINLRLSPFGVDFNQLTEAQKGEIQVFEQLLGQANLTPVEFEEMVRTLSSIRRVDAYVQAAYQQASTAAAQAEGYADETSLLITEATQAVEDLKAKEAKLEAEKKAKLEAEKKAKLEAEKKAKLEAEEKAKLEAEKKAKLEAEEKAKLEAEEKAKLEAEEKAKLEAEEKAKPEPEKTAKPEPEEPAIPEPDKSIEPADPAADTQPGGIIVKIGEKHDVF